jgi:hypothetical protein
MGGAVIVRVLLACDIGSAAGVRVEEMLVLDASTRETAHAIARALARVLRKGGA